MSRPTTHRWMTGMLSGLLLAAPAHAASAPGEIVTEMLIRGDKTEKQEALAICLRAPGEVKEEIVEAWQDGAAAADRCALLVPLCMVISPEEAAQILLDSPQNGLIDCPEQQYVLASRLLVSGDRLPGAKAFADASEAAAAFDLQCRRIADMLSESPDWRVRRVAAELVGRFGGSGTNGCVSVLLSDDEWPVRLCAIESLAHPAFAGARAGTLSQLLESGDRTEQFSAVTVYGRCGDAAGLAAAVGHPDSAVQRRAVEEAGYLLNRQGVGDSDDVRLLAARLERLRRESKDEELQPLISAALSGPGAGGEKK